MKLKNKLRHAILLLYLICGRFERASQGKTRVLVFHHLDKPKQFDRLLSFIVRKYNVITFDDFLMGNVSHSRLNIILSFDDGYLSWYSKGIEIFSRYNVKPLVFVNSDFIGLDESASFKYCAEKIKTWPEKSLSEDELIAISNFGCEVGGHTMRHTDMTAPDSSIQEMTQNLALDRDNLEGLLQAEVRTFSYPFGRHNVSSAKVARQVGYKFAFTSDSGLLDDSVDCYHLNRTNVGMRSCWVAEAYIEGCSEALTRDLKIIRDLIRCVR